MLAYSDMHSHTIHKKPQQRFTLSVLSATTLCIVNLLFSKRVKCIRRAFLFSHSKITRIPYVCAATVESITLLMALPLATWPAVAETKQLLVASSERKYDVFRGSDAQLADRCVKQLIVPSWASVRLLRMRVQIRF